MTNEDGTVWIVFNGEIYNFLELRKRLIAKGHTFKSHCDTEVIIHLYEELGPDCVRELRGMFAFAIWDAKKQRLFVARDRVGIKPLYYCQTRDALYFASELKGIIWRTRTVSRGNPTSTRCGNFFFVQLYSGAGDALFQEVRKLLPGHYLTVEQGQVTQREYWDLRFTRDRWNTPWEEAIEELHGLLGKV